MVAALAIAACAPPSTADDPDVVPPVLGQAAIEAWFDAGHYLRWACEPAAHDAAAPSPHGRIRLCANPIATGDPLGVAQIDAALVLEIVDPGGAIVGRGAQRHTRTQTGGVADGSADGSDWYWYMRVPADSATVHDASGLAADGWGFEGPPQTYCSACHQMAPDLVFAMPLP
ncbi:MAG TPA: hypothetical protein VH165_37340 [Kofleriaceae bacterium]|nr:hypothetical protein [Kofleriaceae bacterium]